MTDDTTRGVHLNGKQLVFVLMAAGVICGVMFLFGVLVGRGVQAERGPVGDGTMIGAAQVIPDARPASDSAGARPSGSQADDLSYAGRLSRPDGAVEPLKAPPASSPSAGGAAADLPQPPPDVPEDGPMVNRAEPAAAASFTVQVVAVKKAGDADVIVKRLKARGYQARVVAPEPGDRTGVYRVKIGSFKTRSDADAVARKIETEGQYKPWVTR
jgi:cell division septation protein DedD